MPVSDRQEKVIEWITRSLAVSFQENRKDRSQFMLNLACFGD